MVLDPCLGDPDEEAAKDISSGLVERRFLAREGLSDALGDVF